MARPRKAGPKPAQSYRYPEADLAARPEIGAQAHFNKPKPPVNRLMLFPRTGAWENLKKALRVEFEETVWDHLAGTTSAPFPAGEHSQVAVKVIDPRGNELLVVKKLEEAT